ncbi:MAG: hypothetical protein JRI68_22705 [Deltaproteobacteria bacterium]|nr:hypothetical protein [Deltaproteobacteria bacterium]
MAPGPTTIIAQDRQDTWSERSFAGPKQSPWRALAHGLLVPPGRRSRSVKRAVGRALKWTARGLYLAPGLLLAMLIMRLGDLPGGGALTVAFVCLVVLYFTLLNGYVVASVVAWRASRRGSPTLRLPFSKAGGDALGLLVAGTIAAPGKDQAPAEPDSLIRGCGTVVELTPRIAKGRPVIRDVWLPEASRPMRITEMVAFAIVAPDQPPIIVSTAAAPALLRPPERQELVGALPAFGRPTQDVFNQHIRGGDTLDTTRAWMLTLREGDEVEVVGTVIDGVDDVERFELDGQERSLPASARAQAASPYRHGKRARGIIVGGSDTRPLAIRCR